AEGRGRVGGAALRRSDSPHPQQGKHQRPVPVVRYAKPFFDLQLRFAHKVGALAGLPLARALLEYTNLYIRLGLGHGFDHMKRALARPGRVVVVSWLYNLEADRRLFPPS